MKRDIKEPPHSYSRLPPLPIGDPIPIQKPSCPNPFNSSVTPLSVAKNKLDQIVANISGKTPIHPSTKEVPVPSIDTYVTQPLLDPKSSPPGLQPTETQSPYRDPTISIKERTTTSAPATGKCPNHHIHRHPQAPHISILTRIHHPYDRLSTQGTSLIEGRLVNGLN